MNKEILRLAIPNIISNISIPLLSSVDTLLMGHQSSLHLGAIGLGSMIFNFIYWNFGFLRMGTTGLTAQAFGREDAVNIGRNLLRPIIIALMITVLLFIFLDPLYEILARFLSVREIHSDMVYEYFRIRMWAAPATLMLYAFLGWFFGLQNAIYPLILTVLVNITNIAVSAYLVNVAHWDISGVAWGTVVAQYTGLAAAIIMVLFKYRHYLKGVSLNSALKISEFVSYLKLNTDIFIRTLFLTFAFLFFYGQSSLAGDVILAVNVVLMQFINWMSYGIDGFAFASESLIGKYKGADDKPRLHLALKLSFFWGGMLALLYGVIYLGFGRQLMSIFTSDTAVIDAADPYLIWMALLPIIGFASYIWDGVYIGLTASKAMRNTMFLSIIIYFGTYYLLGGVHASPHYLWLSLVLFLAARAVFQSILYRKYGTQLT